MDKLTDEQMNDWDNSNKKMECARMDAQIKPSNIFWNKRKLLLTLTSGLMQNLLEFHTSLEHTFHPITPRSRVHPRHWNTHWQRRTLSLQPSGTGSNRCALCLWSILSLFSHSVNYRFVNRKQEEGIIWIWNDIPVS